MSSKEQQNINLKETQFGRGDGINVHVYAQSQTPTVQSSREHQNMEATKDVAAICSRTGCQERAITHPDWDGNFCSKTCALLRCRELFLQWTTAQQSKERVFKQRGK